ncbi:NADH dehydrogenase subunit G [Gillisia sp. Hel_I_86]|uniref:NADH-quinone oxidoreductase subunit NuoG n=1 Tax=Gillisia sp. Hel_I_86 TaxID=1249981 RepID=UPI00119AA4A0|nr:NADH-quinone oxidoreductase subunit NuoG [Gillisia sp. Hel_I_86]TVZ28644.1 NADH dehydrogenase subunit G [Gillisia sp. Hel_I_86]
MKVEINIDNKVYEVDKNTNLLEACLSLKMDLPYFCWHPELGSVGACRQCAIIKYKDADDKKGKLVIACMEPVTENVRISLQAPEAHGFRADNVEALMINHPHDCPVCDEGGECHLQDMTVMTGHNYRRYRFNKRTHNNQYLGPFINHEMNRCIQCYRCVRFYKDYAGGKDFDVFSAHDDIYFGRHEPGVLENEFSGNLVEVCPTGVFTDKPLKKHYTRKWDLTNGPSVCHNCSLGCNIIGGERYGSIRRIMSRYNGDVNGYFICDRGRFGYEYVNSEKRLLAPLTKTKESFIPVIKEQAVQEIREITSGKKLIGIGSPKASLESNFLLRKWVGAENFYAGIPASEAILIHQIIKILKEGTVTTPSLNEVKEYDAVFILGEDVTNTAPMLALNLRQAAKNKPGEVAKDLKIPVWNDAATREVVQEATGPFYVATINTTKLDEIATQSYYAHPDDIARLAYNVANTIDGQLPSVENDKKTQRLASSVAEAMLNAKKPLIVAGTSLYNEAIVQAAATLAFALKAQGKYPGLLYVVPEVNSIGLSMISNQSLDDAFERADRADGAIIMENDLYQRMDKRSTDTFFQQQKNIISLDYLENGTTNQSNYILPAGTFAEADGTVVNNEGRAQRFYKAHRPDNDIRSSWEWIQEIMTDKPSVANLDEIVSAMVREFPELEAVQSVAPPAGFREGTQKIPREPHRYSGRTAMHADAGVSEPKPPEDPDSALSFTMEGFTGAPPAAITPFYWTPGWNSVQAINKYQIEVGGPLHGGNPGKRLFGSVETTNLDFSENIPSHFSPKQGKWWVLPLYHIFGSDELSAQGPAVKERIPQAYIALNEDDALDHNIKEGDLLEISVKAEKHHFPARLHSGIPQGIFGLPKGLKETAGIEFPFWTTIKSISNG